MLGALRTLTAQSGREAANGGVEVRVRMAPVEEFKQMLPQRRVVAVRC